MSWFRPVPDACSRTCRPINRDPSFCLRKPADSSGARFVTPVFFFFGAFVAIAAALSRATPRALFSLSGTVPLSSEPRRPARTSPYLKLHCPRLGRSTGCCARCPFPHPVVFTPAPRRFSPTPQISTRRWFPHPATGANYHAFVADPCALLRSIFTIFL